MATPQGSPVWAFYVVGLGRAGSSGVARFAYYNKSLTMKTFVEQARYWNTAIKPIVKVQIIDMVAEADVRKLASNANLREGDDIVLLEPTRIGEAFSIESIRRFAENHMPHILRYMPYISRLALQPGGGVARFRPLARYFLSYIGGLGSMMPVFASAIYQDARRDFHDIIDMGPQIIWLIFNLSLGGGFGSGSFIDVAQLILRVLSDEHSSRGGGPIQEGVLFNIMLPTGFTHEPRPQDLVGGNEEETKASAGAALIDLLYVLYKNLKRGENVTDDITKLFENQLTLSGYGIKLYQANRRINLAFTSYSILGAETIEEVYKQMDEGIAAWLMAFIFKASTEGLLQDNNLNIRMDISLHPGVLERLKSYVEGINEGIAELLLMPVTVFDTIVLSFNIKQFIPDALHDLIDRYIKLENEITVYEKRLKELNNEENNIKKKIDTLNRVENRMDDITKSKTRVETTLEKIKDGELSIFLNELNYARQNAGLERLPAANASLIKAQRHESNVEDNLLRVIREELQALKGELSERVMDQVMESLREKNEPDELMKFLEQYEDVIQEMGIISRVIDLIKSITDELSEAKGTLASISTIGEQKCGLIRRAGCRLRDNARQLEAKVGSLLSRLTRISNELRSLQGKSREIMGEIKSKINKLKEDLARELELKRTEIERVESELSRLKSLLEELDSRIKEYGNEVIKEIRSRYSFMPLDIVRTLVERIIITSALKRETRSIDSISKLIRAAESVSGELANELYRYFGDYIVREANERPSRIQIDVELLRNLNVPVRTQDTFIIFSMPEKYLYDKIRENIASLRQGLNVHPVLLEHIEDPFIAIVRVLYRVPLLALKDVQEILNSYLKEVSRSVYEVEEVKERTLRYKYKITSTVEKSVREPRGAMFHGFNRIAGKDADKFNKFLNEMWDTLGKLLGKLQD